MAVCNIFTKIEKPTGNFLMFSNYTEDLCKYRVFDSNYRVAPSKFYALDVDFPKKLSELQLEVDELNKKLEILSDQITTKDDELQQLINSGAEQEDIDRCEEELVVLNSQRDSYNKQVSSKEAQIAIYRNLNKYIPRKFQNRYENWLALQKNGVVKNNSFNAPAALWQFLYGVELLELKEYENSNDEIQNTNQFETNIVYEGSISLESYDLHNDMGYGEIVCHIPSETKAKTYKMIPGKTEIVEFNKNYIEGYTEGVDYELDEDDKEVNWLTNINDTEDLPISSEDNDAPSYKFNTIVVCYDVYEGGTLKYKNRPLGVYFTGVFDENGAMSNEKTIYIGNDDVFGASTTYTLRICTRFTPSTSSDTLGPIVDDDNANLGYLLSKLSDSMDKMEKILNDAHVDNTTLKVTLNIIKNNRTNVPYIVGDGVKTPQYWYVNGKCVGEIPNPIATEEEVIKTFDDTIGDI